MPSHTKRFNASLDFDVAQALEKHARRHHLSYSLAINNALKQALLPEHQEERNAALMTGLDRIEYQLKELRVRQRDDATLLREMLGTFVRVCGLTIQRPCPKSSVVAQRGAVTLASSVISIA